VLKVNRSNMLLFPPGSIAAEYTIGVRARQTEGDSGTLFGSANVTDPLWTIGFEGIRFGVFRAQSTMYSSRGVIQEPAHAWHSTVGRNTAELPVAWTDGVDTSQNAVTWANSSGTGQLAVNAPWQGAGSDAEIAEVVIFDRHLTAAEAEAVASILAEPVPSTSQPRRCATRPYPSAAQRLHAHFARASTTYPVHYHLPPPIPSPPFFLQALDANHFHIIVVLRAFSFYDQPAAQIM